MRLLLSLCFASMVAMTLAACGGGGCLVDSDCAGFTNVCIESACVPAGTLPDGGPMDAGPQPDGGPDAGPADAGPPDAEPTDAEPIDAGELDAETDGAIEDAGPPPCEDVTGGWSVGAILAPPCGSAALGNGLTITAGASACELVATSNDVDAAPALDGTFVLAESGSLAGTLSPGAAGPVECTGSLSGTTLTFVCGGCVMQVTRL